MNIRFFNIDLNRSFTVELLKKEWRKVAMNTHPDKGGRAEYFKIAMAEYEYLLGRAVGADFHAWDDAPDSYDSWLSFLANVSPIVREWVSEHGAKVVSMGAALEVTGTWVWISGTNPTMAPSLKTMGLKWASAKHLWFFQGEQWRGNRMSMDNIRGAFGSQSFANKDSNSEEAVKMLK